MKKQQNIAIQKNLNKYDNQLLAILSEDLRASRIIPEKLPDPSVISSCFHFKKRPLGE